MKQPLDGAVVLITGGTGSLGQTLVRRLLRRELGRAEQDHRLLARRGEAVRHEDHVEARARGAPTTSSTTTSTSCSSSGSATCATTRACSARCRDADVVFHAAAMKQVPTCEYFPAQAVATNVHGRGQHGPRGPRHAAARRHGGRRLDRQGVQARQRDGHDQGDPGAHHRRGRTSHHERCASWASATATCSRRAAR